MLRLLHTPASPHVFILALALVAAAATLPAQDLATVPTDAGLSPDRLDRLTEVLEGYVAGEQLPGGVALVARNGRGAYPEAFGYRDREAGAPNPGVEFGLGFSLVEDLGRRGVPGSVGESGWGGAYHSTCWVDPLEDLIVVYVPQVIPARYLDDSGKVRALVYGAIRDTH